MRFYMVQGDVTAPAEGEKAAPIEPQAIFCAGATAHHAGWIRLTEVEIISRLWATDGPITRTEYERVLAAIGQHRAWQREVLLSKGHWAGMRRARKQASAPPQHA